MHRGLRFDAGLPIRGKSSVELELAANSKKKKSTLSQHKKQERCGLRPSHPTVSHSRVLHLLKPSDRRNYLQSADLQT